MNELIVKFFFLNYSQHEILYHTFDFRFLHDTSL